MRLPIFLTDLKELMMLQTKWKPILDELLRNPSLQNIILDKVRLNIGDNVINHRLGRKLTGWRVIGLNGLAQICDHQESNQTPHLTLILESSAQVVCTLEVF